jgi:hypothetical protein
MTLRDQQSALMAALAGNAPVPAGFDAARVHAAASALAFKRARAAAQAWPSLRAMLGEEFRERFAAYATTAPIPQDGGPLADGRCFVRYLARRMPLTDDVRLQTLSIDTRYRRTSSGLLRLCWPRVCFAWLANARCLVVALGAIRYQVHLARVGRR